MTHYVYNLNHEFNLGGLVLQMFYSYASYAYLNVLQDPARSSITTFALKLLKPLGSSS